MAGSPFGTGPTDGVALTPDGRHLYATSAGSGHVLAFDVQPDGGLTALPTLTLEPPAEADPTGIAISPDGRFAYVADPEPEAVRVVAIGADGGLTQVALTPLGGAENTTGVAITPDGDHLYVTVGNPPAAVYGFAIGADGLLTHLAPASVAAIGGAESISVTPDGRYLYVGSRFGTGVQAFAIGADGSLAPVAESPFGAADEVAGIAVTPNASAVYASGDITEGNVSAFGAGPGGSLSLLSGSPFASGVGLPIFASLAVSPNLAPIASFTSTQVGRSNRVDFDASASSDADGTIARFDWDFGDGTLLPNGGPAPSHTYAGPGTYAATLTLTDAEGCTTTLVFTGQTASCNGFAEARAQRQVQVQVADPPPQLRLFGPKRQRLDRAIELRASCDEPCRVTARGKLVLAGPHAKASAARRLKLRPANRSLAAGERATLRLRLTGKALRASLAALADGGTVKAKIVASAADPAGNRSAQARRTIRLKRPR